MDRQWESEPVVSAELARSLIESQFPDLAPAAIEPFGVGWDNTAFLVSGEWVFRFPRRSIAVPLMRVECVLRRRFRWPGSWSRCTASRPPRPPSSALAWIRSVVWT